MSQTIEFINPPNLPDTNKFGFSQIVKMKAGQLAMISGQVGWDLDYQIVSEDLGKQAAKTFENIKACLEALGASPKDLMKLRIYITQYSQEEFSEKVHPQLLAFVDPEEPPAMTLLGVEHLARPEFRIEIEATIVIPETSTD